MAMNRADVVSDLMGASSSNQKDNKQDKQNIQFQMVSVIKIHEMGS